MTRLLSLAAFAIGALVILWMGVAVAAGHLLASVVISELLLMLERFAANGFAAFRDEWQALDVYADKEVVIKTGASDIFGIARGVDSSGGLRLEISGAIQIIKGGEMSLRAVE